MVIGVGYLVYNQYVQPIAHTGEHYISIYGRDRCSITNSLKKFLDKQAIPYQYYPIDKRKNADSLHAKMRVAGINTQFYYLPVVDINGKILIRPAHSVVQSLYFNSN